MINKLLRLSAILALGTILVSATPNAFAQARVFNPASAAITATGNGTTAGAATLNGQSGTVTSEALTTAGAATYVLTLTNSNIKNANALVYVQVSGATTGSPIVSKVTPGTGTCTIAIYNAGAVAFNTAIKIGFCVLSGG